MKLPARMSRSELLAAVLIIVALAIIGVAVGAIWQAWSPRTVGFVYQPHAVIPDESEALVASDGRFTFLTGLVGLVAGLVVWLQRQWRGPVVAVALAIGGFAGAVVADQIGRLLGGGQNDGPVNTLIRLQVAVRAHGLLFVEPVAALLVFLLFVVFASRDDLGRDDEPLEPPPAEFVDPAGREDVRAETP